MPIEYSSNNSGNDWWLTDDDWKSLERSGWVIQWSWLDPKYDGSPDKPTRAKMVYGPDGLPILVPNGKPEGYRWLGSLARYAYWPGDNLEEAVEVWKTATRKDPDEEGCPCCGPPHSFDELQPRA